MMPKSTLILAVMLFAWPNAFAQPSPGGSVMLSGRIIDSQTQQGIENAFVFYSHTTNGTQTNAQGYFALNRIPTGMSELVVAKAGYQTEVKRYQVTAGKTGMKISLEPNIEAENEKMQTAIERLQRAYFLEQFRHIFFGISESGGQCSITNENAMDFFNNEKTNVLEAYANAPLIIENHATGYRIVFVLENFTCFRLVGKIRYTYKGHAFFMEMIPQLEGNLWDWRKNRHQAYLGSLRHFLAALAKDGLAEVGFEINLAAFSADENAILSIGADINRYNILRVFENDGKYLLKFPDFLQVDYITDNSRQTSWLFLNRNYAIFDHTGRFIKPFDPITVHGQWADRSFSFHLPRDYTPPPSETLGYSK
ncbi:MAG: carboxypeptidase-like regulatory domain-containing protein [bacterium]